MKRLHALHFIAVLPSLLFSCSSPLVRNSEVTSTNLTLIPIPAVSPEKSQYLYHFYAEDVISTDSVFFNEALFLSQTLGIQLELAPAVGVPGTSTAPIQLSQDPALEADGSYRLTVNTNGIAIHAGTPSGAFYAIQTLLQLQPEPRHSDGAVRFFHAEIADQPRFAHRGLLLDCCRHFMEVGYIKRMIDLLARYKMNVLHWHLTEDQGWRFESYNYPLLTEVGAWRKQPDGQWYGGFYTIEEMREVVQYAQQRHVTVIPEIEMPGHATAAIASYPWLSCTGDTISVETEWGVFKDIFCAGSDTTLRFIETVLDEVMDIFPSRYIHIGGDEAPKTRWDACEKCQNRIHTHQLHDSHELQSWFISHVATYLAEKGRQAIGWDEILEGGLPAGCMIQSWRGMQGGIDAARQGVQAIMSPTSHAYFDYDVNTTDLHQVYSFEPIPAELNEEEAKFIVGGECNMWTERAPQHSVDSKVFPRLLAMAEVLWSPANQRDFEAFLPRLRREYPRLDRLGVEYGPETPPFTVESTIDSTGCVTFNITNTSNIDSAAYRLTGEMRKTFSKQVNVTTEKSNTPQLLELFACRGQRCDTVKLPYANHLATGKPIELKHQPSSYYPGKSSQALTDGVMGSYDFRDGHWQGFSKNDLHAVIDLGETEIVRSALLPFYTYSNAWIFMPTSVTIEASVDGKHWQMIGRANNPLDERDKQQGVVNIHIELDKHPSRFLRVIAYNRGECPPWHDAPGEPAWLFVSEICLYASSFDELP